MVGVRIGREHALKALRKVAEGPRWAMYRDGPVAPTGVGRSAVLEDAPDFEFLPARVGEEHRAVHHAVGRPCSGAHL